eukprot:2382746-Pyramimonas_sp.AAC.1
MPTEQVDAIRRPAQLSDSGDELAHQLARDGQAEDAAQLLALGLCRRQKKGAPVRGCDPAGGNLSAGPMRAHAHRLRETTSTKRIGPGAHPP